MLSLLCFNSFCAVLLLCDCLQDDADAVDNDTMKQRNDEEEDGEGRQDAGEVRGKCLL